MVRLIEKRAKVVAVIGAEVRARALAKAFLESNRKGRKGT
jgi:hypothetical protein